MVLFAVVVVLCVCLFIVLGPYFEHPWRNPLINKRRRLFHAQKRLDSLHEDWSMWEHTYVGRERRERLQMIQYMQDVVDTLKTEVKDVR